MVTRLREPRRFEGSGSVPLQNANKTGGPVRFLRRAENGLDLLELEEQKLGMNHAEAGRLLTESWGLPEEFRVVNGRHHDSCDGTEIDLLWIVHVACRLADTLGFAVVSPRLGLAAGELAMPPGTSWKKSPDELCGLIEERISAVT
jgi:hypothetical protein